MKTKGNFSFEPTVEVGTTVYTCDSHGIQKWIVFEVSLIHSPYRDEYGNVIYHNDSNRDWCKPSLREVYDLISSPDEKKNLTIGIDKIFLKPEEAAKDYSEELIKRFKKQ